MRGVRLTQSQRKGIRDVANVGHKRTGGTWHCFEINTGNTRRSTIIIVRYTNNGILVPLSGIRK